MDRGKVFLQTTTYPEARDFLNRLFDAVVKLDGPAIRGMRDEILEFKEPEPEIDPRQRELF